MAKRTGNQRKPKRAARAKAPATPASLPPVPPAAPKAPPVWVSPALFSLFLLFFLRQSYTPALLWLAVEALWSLANRSRNADNGTAPPSAPIVALVACLATIALAIGTLPAFHWMFTAFQQVNPLKVQWILLFLWIRLMFAFKALPALSAAPDPGAGRSRLLWLLLFLGAAWLRLHRLGDIPGTYWDDCAEDLFNARNKVEMGNFVFLLPLGSEEPCFQYLAGMMSFFFQETPSIIVHKLTLILVGMLSLWVFYLLGKEAGGRRVGLVMLGFGAVSKTFVMLSSQIMLHFNTLTLGTGLALLFFTRLFKKRDARHYMQWGAACAFGVYTYVSYRALLPVLLFAPLVWALSDPKEREETTPGEKVFVAVTLAFFAVYCMYGFNFFRFPSFLSNLLKESGFFFPGLVLAILLPPLLKFWVSAYPGGRHSQLSGWLVGALLFTLLSAAVFGHPWILERLSTLDMFKGMTAMQKLGRVGQRFQDLMCFLVYGGGNVWDDSFYGYPSLLLAASGAAYAAGRPRGLRPWLLLLSAAGVGTFLLSSDPHSGKVLASAVVLYLLGSMAVVRIWDALGESIPSLKPGRVGAVVLLAVLSVSAVYTYLRVYRDWMDTYVDSNSLAVKQARRDAAAGYHVYIANSPDYPSQITRMASADVLLEGSGVGYLHKENDIDLGPGEKGTDVVVLFAPDQEKNMTALAAGHPGAQVTAVPDTVNPRNPANLRRIQIPFASLAGGPEPHFNVRQGADNEWLRVYFTHFTVGRGAVWSRDRRSDLNAPHPPCTLGGAFSARFFGGLRIGSRGKYRMTYGSDIPSIVKMDGKRVIVDRPLFRKGRTTTAVDLPLDAGNHQIEMICEFKDGGGAAPVLEVRPKDAPSAAPLPIGAPPSGYPGP